MTAGPPVTRRLGPIAADPSRVISLLFVPSHAREVGAGGRTSDVVDHVLALSDAAVTAALDSLVQRFAWRHRDLAATFEQHAQRVANRVEPGVTLSSERRLLLGATFTQEYAVQAAAVCNPSMFVLGEPADGGGIRVGMSVRQIGEGHRSSIGFRTGVVDGTGAPHLDEASPFAVAGDVTAAELDARSFDSGTRRRDDVASRCYDVTFPATTELSERVLFPSGHFERFGMEDVRFVRFVDDDGSVAYHGTYTAFDGAAISLQLLSTTDFVSFSVRPLWGSAAVDKGLALFPRRIGGSFVALARSDGTTNSVVRSSRLDRWEGGTAISPPVEAWEVVQRGNCGSPIETPAGWLVLTHGVGTMRTYSIGAWLLDLDEPERVIASLRQPLLTPGPDEQDGYVPNVVYSCGGLLHAGHLVIPFGVGDASIKVATAQLDDVLDAMEPCGP